MNRVKQQPLAWGQRLVGGLPSLPDCSREASSRSSRTFARVVGDVGLPSALVMCTRWARCFFLWKDTSQLWSPSRKGYTKNWLRKRGDYLVFMSSFAFALAGAFSHLARAAFRVSVRAVCFAKSFKRDVRLTKFTRILVSFVLIGQLDPNVFIFDQRGQPCH